MANFLLFLIISLTNLVVAVYSFQARNCYNSHAYRPIELISLQVSPARIQIPSITRVNFDVIVREELGTVDTPLAVRVSMQKIVQIGVGWLSYRYRLPVPCLDVGGGLQVGSCDYEDICALVSNFNNATNNAQCAEAARYGFSCSCPIPARRYRTSRGPIIVDLTQGVDQIPSTMSILLEGDYIARVEVRRTLANDYDENLLGCFELAYEIRMNVRK